MERWEFLKYLCCELFGPIAGLATGTVSTDSQQLVGYFVLPRNQWLENDCSIRCVHSLHSGWGLCPGIIWCLNELFLPAYLICNL